MNSVNTKKTLEERFEEIEIIYNLSKILTADLEKPVIAIILELIDAGVNPESIADGNFYFIRNYIYIT